MNSEREEIYTGLSNYYGTVIFVKENGKYYIELDNWDQTRRKEITEELYVAAKEIQWREEGEK